MKNYTEHTSYQVIDNNQIILNDTDDEQKAIEYVKKFPLKPNEKLFVIKCVEQIIFERECSTSKETRTHVIKD